MVLRGCNLIKAVSFHRIIITFGMMELLLVLYQLTADLCGSEHIQEQISLISWVLCSMINVPLLHNT